MELFNIDVKISSQYFLILTQDIKYKYYKFHSLNETSILASDKETKEIYKVHIPIEVNRRAIKWIGFYNSLLYIVLFSNKLVIYVYQNLKLVTKIIPDVKYTSRYNLLQHTHFLYIFNYNILSGSYNLEVLNLKIGRIINKTKFVCNKRFYLSTSINLVLFNSPYEKDYFYFNFQDDRSDIIQYTIGNGNIMCYSSTSIIKEKS